MVVAQIPLLGRYVRLKFSLATWAFTFSWAAVASTLLFWIKAEHVSGGGPLAYLVLAAISVLVGGIAIRTVVAISQGRLLRFRRRSPCRRRPQRRTLRPQWLWQPTNSSTCACNFHHNKGEPTMSELPNIVLVHGAWADGSCWRTSSRNFKLRGTASSPRSSPRSSLADDVARLRQVLVRQNGPTIVAGHSYGGQIMTSIGTDAPNAAGLVYIAAFGLDEGESIGALLASGPPTPALANLDIDEHGFAWLPKEDFVNHFAADVVKSGKSHVRRSATAFNVDARRRDGHAGLEVVADLVHGR